MGSIGVTELVLVFVILLLIFGGRKIPELARGLGSGIRNFKDSLQGEESQDKKDEKDEKDEKDQKDKEE
jgi:sec-independent protein translocase protein TatA